MCFLFVRLIVCLCISLLSVLFFVRGGSGFLVVVIFVSCCCCFGEGGSLSCQFIRHYTDDK